MILFGDNNLNWRNNPDLKLKHFEKTGRTRTHDVLPSKKSVIVISAEVPFCPSSFLSAASPEPVQSTSQTPTHPPESLSGLQLQTCAHLLQQQQQQWQRRQQQQLLPCYHLQPLQSRKGLDQSAPQSISLMSLITKSSKKLNLWILKIDGKERKKQIERQKNWLQGFFSILAKKVTVSWIQTKKLKQEFVPSFSWTEDRNRSFVHFLLLLSLITMSSCCVTPTPGHSSSQKACLSLIKKSKLHLL